MKTSWRTILLAPMFMLAHGGIRDAGAQDDDSRAYAGAGRGILHIRHSVTTSQAGFPQSLFMYHLLDGAASRGEARALKGTISLENHGSQFSEVLWALAYWQGKCPADDQSLAGANVIWSEIQKNPKESEDTLSVDLHFPNPLPMSGCVGFVFAGGPLVQGTGAEWGATNDLYLLPGGCGAFGANLDSQGFPNPLPLSTLHGWLPTDALHLVAAPMNHRIPQGGTSKASLTRQIETFFSTPVTVDAGDCVVVFYGRKGNGAIDDETQIHAVLVP